MKNITVTVPDEIYRRSRMKAAEQGISVSAAVRGYLVSFATEEEAGTQAASLARLFSEFDQARANAAAQASSGWLTSDQLHDRAPRRREAEYGALRNRLAQESAPPIAAAAKSGS